MTNHSLDSPSSQQCSDQIEWLTATEAASHLKVKTRTLLLWIRQGKVEGYKSSGANRRVCRFRRSDLDDGLWIVFKSLLKQAAIDCELSP
jgi:excisionase family DNA binding protein